MVPVFLAGGVFECDIAHRSSVAVLCMLYKIRCTRCTLFMSLYLGRMCLCGLHVVLWSHMSLFAAEPRSTGGLHSLVSFLWTDLRDHAFEGVGLSCFTSRAHAFLLAELLAPLLSPTVFPFSSFILLVGIVGLGS